MIHYLIFAAAVLIVKKTFWDHNRAVEQFEARRDSAIRRVVEG